MLGVFIHHGVGIKPYPDVIVLEFEDPNKWGPSILSLSTGRVQGIPTEGLGPWNSMQGPSSPGVREISTNMGMEYQESAKPVQCDP